MYAVIDTETTGLSPEQRHRVIEVAVVLLDEHGRFEREWVTLLNPQRDLGPQHIHGIRAADILAAPDFAEIAPTLAGLLAGRMVVGHNVEFDLEFLRAEFARAGVNAPLVTERSMCTMALAAYLHPGAKRTLGACCAAAGIPLDGWHSALADTRATARLFVHYLASFSQPPPWQWAFEEVRRYAWPEMSPSVATPVVRPVQAGGRHGWMSRLVDRLPRASEPPQADSYLALLDRVLSEREVTEDGAEQLVQVATRLGLTRCQVSELHRFYVTGLADAFWSDRDAGPVERRDLDRVAIMLGHTVTEVDEALAQVSAGRYLPPARPGSNGFPVGSRVVFTGDMIDSREEWHQRASAAGFHPDDVVTPETTFVVAADVDSLSLKAKEARRLGVPIIGVEDFQRLSSATRALAPRASISETGAS